MLHDLFGVPFEEVAPIGERTPAAARQLASRARRRVQGAGDVPDPDRARQREVVAAFLAASRNGDFEALPAGFLYAGAAAVVGTLWRVDDLATAILIRRFYQEWLGRQDGGRMAGRESIAGALRRAQQAVREMTAREVLTAWLTKEAIARIRSLRALRL